MYIDECMDNCIVSSCFSVIKYDLIVFIFIILGSLEFKENIFTIDILFI